MSKFIQRYYIATVTDFSNDHSPPRYTIVDTNIPPSEDGRVTPMFDTESDAIEWWENYVVHSPIQL